VSASWFVSTQQVGLSASCLVSDLMCQQVGLSASCLVSDLMCQQVGLSALSKLVCQRVDCQS